MISRRRLIGGTIGGALVAGPALGTALGQDRLPVGGAAASAAMPGLVADEAVLRRHGAKFDGVTDDRAALQAAIDDARRHTPSVLSLPSVAIVLPPGCVLLSGPLRTGDCNTVIRGQGQDVTVLRLQPGGSGLLEHGTAQKPAKGYLQLQDLSLADGNDKGSGCFGVQIQFDAGAPQAAMTWQGVALRKWTKPARIVNCPRNWHCENVTVFGPDFAMQDAAGFEIASTPDFSQGCFTYVFINVLVANYAWGWRYDIQSPLEGQRFYSCTCYNGWGMVQARVHAAADRKNNIDQTYRSVIWYFADCDWQGYGYALDLEGCRDVQVRGGFYIANRNTQHLAVPEGRPRRRYMSFVRCSDILLDGVKFDVFAGSEAGLSLIYVDGTSENFRSRDTTIYALAPLWAAFEFADPGHAGRTATMGEFDTVYASWAGGTRVRDPGGNQLAQSTIREMGLGDVSTDGRWTIRASAQHQVTDGQGRMAIKFPTRPGGAPWFAMPPEVMTETLNALVGVPSGSLVSVQRDGFTLAFAGAKQGLQLDVHYTASGR